MTVTMKKPNTKIALQLYTVREFLKTPQDIESSFKKIRDIGYEMVELASITGIDDANLKQLFDRSGIFCASMHIKVAQITDELNLTIQKMKTLGCVHAAVAWSGPEYRNPEGVKKLAQILDTAGKTFREHGLVLSYHNHKFEFEKFGAKVMLEQLYDLTDPQNLSAQLDLCWVQLGGTSPATWIRKMQGRIWSVHYKDVTVKNDAHVLAEVGEGNLDWPAILQVCTDTQVQVYIVEQDTCERDPFEAVRISYQNLRKMGVQ
jgi:sugar phosphate isomerase/epimerase